MTAEQIAGGLDGQVPPSDLGSVYRNLETLEGLGVVRHMHAGHGPGLYAIAHDADEGSWRASAAARCAWAMCARSR